MQVALPDLHTAATLVLNRDRPLTDEGYFAFCAANPELDVERTAKGELLLCRRPEESRIFAR